MRVREKRVAQNDVDKVASDHISHTVSVERHHFPSTPHPATICFQCCSRTLFYFCSGPDFVVSLVFADKEGLEAAVLPRVFVTPLHRQDWGIVPHFRN